MKKKISLAVIYTLISALVLAVIITAFVKKDFSPKLTLPSYNERGIEVVVANNTSKTDAFDDENNYKNFVSKYNDAFKISVLYAIVSGKMDAMQDITKLTSAPTFTNGYTVTISFKEDQVLYLNNKEYKESLNSNENTYFDIVIFNVSSKNGLTQNGFYFHKTGETKYYKLTTLANLDELYDMFKNMPQLSVE